ncbi:MAG: hypothetical protein U0637_10665 [Phycisphaerales bacterium]
MLSLAQLAAVRPGAGRSPVGQQALGSDPWQFVPAVWGKLRDPAVTGALRGELSFALALALARLGLGTAAREALAGCDGAHPAREALAGALGGFPADEVSGAELAGTLDENLRALRGPVRSELEGHLPAWRAWMAGVRVFRTASGAGVVLGAGGQPLLFVDGPQLAETLRRAAPKDGPFYVDGMHVPQAVEALWQVTARPAGEVQARIVLMAGSPEEALTALCMGAMAGVLSSARVEVWCGPDCPGRVAAEAGARLACTLGFVITVPGVPAHLARWPRGEPARALEAVGREQNAACERLRAGVDAWEAGVDEGARRERLLHWRRARPRVLLSTTRYSTYVQHATEDLAEVLRREGCGTLVCKEPDDHSVHSALGLLGAVERHRPDVVILINHVRSQVAESLPRRVPVVTWVQDAMPHLFDERTGGRCGGQDFVVGHLHPEMFRQFGFPRGRSLYTPVLASDLKFHDAPVGEEARARFGCEVAYISHQSETAERFCERLVREGPGDSPAPRVVAHLAPRVREVVAACTVHGRLVLESLREVTAEAFRAAGLGGPPARVFSLVLTSATYPLAERVLRQQMMHWAADLADRKGWRLHIYGKGWEDHPRFAGYAQGELGHGEDLRAAYQCAAVQLHAGLGGVHHQRVMEAALSGGCTLVRMKAEDVRMLEWWAQNEVARTVDRRTLVRAFADRDDFFLCPVADHWQAMLVQLMYDRLGVAPQHDRVGQFALQADQLERPWGERGGTPLAFEAAWLAGHPADAGFWDRGTFDDAVSRVVESPARRASLAAWQRGAVRRHFSLSGLVDGVMSLVASSEPALLPAMHR